MDQTLKFPKHIGNELHEFVTKLFPIHRSVTGNGVRQTLKAIQELTPIVTHEVPSGTQVFDWEVPQEWNVKDAFIKDVAGNKIVDFKSTNLHLVNGSRPVNETIPWSELKEKLHTLPNRPHAIPYRTCFHRDDWGFCVSKQQFDEMENHPDALYEVQIDSEFKDGSMTYGQTFIQGNSDHEVLLSAHICHPSLANDNLSGIAIATYIARALRNCSNLRYSYRIVLAPATIGAITWLARNQEDLHKIKHGLVLSLLGDAGSITYKKSRDSSARINRVVEQVLTGKGDQFEIRPFEPFGYDERQYCSPGVNLPMGCLMRTPSGEFDEYHTSDDNLEFVRSEHLEDSFNILAEIIYRLESDRVYINAHPNAEPRLDHYGLYDGFPVSGDKATAQRAVQWILNLSDGNYSLADIAAISGISEQLINDTSEQLQKFGLVTPLY
ncbi:MAG: DUF4910 domain-containing protein [Pseudomonadota bacterium]